MQPTPFPNLRGRTLVDVLRSSQGKGSAVVEGRPPASHFDVVLELDGGERHFWFDAAPDSGVPSKKLTPIVPDEHGIDRRLEFRNRRIRSVRVDAQGEPLLELDNGLALQLVVDAGVQICVRPVKDLVNA